jgi:acyl carrier protein
VRSGGPGRPLADQLRQMKFLIRCAVIPALYCPFGRPYTATQGGGAAGALRVGLMKGLILLGVFAGAALVVAGARLWNRHLARKHLAGRSRLNSQDFGRRFYPDNASVAARVRDILQEHVRVDLAQLDPSDQPVRDLYLAAIDGEETHDVIAALEECFGIKIEDGDAARMRSVDDIVRYVIAKTEEKGLVNVERARPAP